MEENDAAETEEDNGAEGEAREQQPNDATQDLMRSMNQGR